MPVDPAGITVGLGGILLAFKGVVDTVNLFDLIIANDNGSKHLALRYYVERHKTTIWGDEFRPDNELDSPLLGESDATRRLIAGVLTEMLATHQLAEKFLQRFAMVDFAQLAKADQNNGIGIESAFVKKVKELRDSHGQKNRFLWGIKDKQKFTEIVDRMGSLNADLRNLVHGQNMRSLAAAISSSLLPQIKDSLYLIALQQTESIDPLLKLSARLKELQTASDQHAGPKAPILKLNSVFKADPDQLTIKKSTGMFLHGNSQEQRAWVEWVPLPQEQSWEHKELVLSRVESLSVMLSAAKDPEFRIPPCLALVEDTDHLENWWRKLGFVFAAPANQVIPSTGPTTLTDFIAATKPCPPLLNERFELAYKLASAVSLIHAAKWIHKGIRSENICFFNNAEGAIDARNPWISGFDYSRPESQTSLRDRVKNIPAIDIYYHPDVPFKGFDRSRDIYSLGVVLLEIAIWSPLQSVIERSTEKELGAMTMSEYKAFFLESLPMVGSLSGASYRDAVRACLTGDVGQADRQDDGDVGRAFLTKVLQRLSYCRA